jgi:hypothetical protein
MPMPARSTGTRPTGSARRAPLRVRERRLHLGGFDRQIGGGFIQKERRELADERAELLRLGPLVTQPRDLLTDQRVRRDVQLVGYSLLNLSASPRRHSIRFARRGEAAPRSPR